MTTSDWFGTTRPLVGSAGISRNPGLRAWNIAGREFRIIRSCQARSTLASGVAVHSTFGSGSSGGNLNSKRPSSSVIVAYRWSREKTRARLIASRVLRLRTRPRMNDALSAELPLPATDCALAEPQSITQEKKIAKETVRSRTLWRRKVHATESLAGTVIATVSILANYYTEKSISLEGLVAAYALGAASMLVHSTPKTLFYNQGTQKYQLEQNLQPGEQMWMDIGKLIRENVPDKTGKTLPSDLTTGSYEFRDLTNKVVGSLFEGKIIYDKTYGHVTYGCSLCCGYTTPMPLWYDPISVIITSFQDDGVFAWYPCENQYDDVSTAFYNRWSSGAPSVVTVDYYGTHNGIAVGSTTSQTFAVLQSNNVHLMCPTHGYTPSGSANVTPAFTVGYNAYIAVDHITAATSCTWAGLQVPYIYMGDAYRGTYRAAEQ